ncbi:hypothetical protein N7499_008271 [Penicillium canescens]|uniref:Uncharacterized protein n=1 Tax=Penicillium canescens TaxID=5083 RepID=A0AAD6HZL1_PENCN|nr:uncharacterized protein N7446_013305 [Penicillium canescens]KAJ5985448.1 hypothetical protein N7522_012644 [Penicillium canescens]KAJ6022951.1 hypothetical protein N7460_013346 [Penicillium canescens]KAJ6025787.1 hypothetical protein N7444_013466 [Penicillium canescens]KAJ6042239.1 hypothetical protein N7446_013305 [Penicillium canescens]KAJ6076290.1 hypothetical protein N7499_008271 [Penicillium canescens]
MPSKGLIIAGLELPEPETSNGDPVEQLHKVELAHQRYPSLPQEKLDAIHLEAIHHAIEAKDKAKALEIEKTLAQDSQYEPVRAAVRNTYGGEVTNTV